MNQHVIQHPPPTPGPSSPPQSTETTDLSPLHPMEQPPLWLDWDTWGFVASAVTE